MYNNYKYILKYICKFKMNYNQDKYSEKEKDSDKDDKDNKNLDVYYDGSSISSDISEISSYSDISEDDSVNSENEFYSKSLIDFNEASEKKNELLFEESRNDPIKKDNLHQEKYKKNIIKKYSNYKNNNVKLNNDLNTIYNILKHRINDGYFSILESSNNKSFTKFIRRYIN